jgi:hypothetical protein
MHGLCPLVLVLCLSMARLAYAANACTYHTVRLGDTCFSLGIPESLNPHISCRHLRPGQHICMFVSNFCGPNSFLHTIQYGQTCYSIGNELR